jgi:hypothetical protein
LRHDGPPTLDRKDPRWWAWIEDVIADLLTRPRRCPLDQRTIDQQVKLFGTFRGRVRPPLDGLGGWRWFELEQVLPEYGVTESDLRYYATVRNPFGIPDAKKGKS